MITHILVCPFNNNFLATLKGYACVLTTKSAAEIDSAIENTARYGILLHAISWHSSHPLGLLEFNREWARTPLALHVPSIGTLNDFFRILPALRELNIKISIPVNNVENITALRILASLQISCAIDFSSGVADWDALVDLAAYSLLGQSPHAEIEPFTYIVKHYQETGMTDFGSVYFDDILRFIHADSNGRLAFSSSDLINKQFFSENVETLKEMDSLPIYQKQLTSWRTIFTTINECTTCIGWRICGGKFSSEVSQGNECTLFSKELLDLVEQRVALEQRKQTVWSV